MSMPAAIHGVKRYLCVKRLTVHDGFTNKSVKLPRAEARFFIGELRNRQAQPVVGALACPQACRTQLQPAESVGHYAKHTIHAVCLVIMMDFVSRLTALPVWQVLLDEFGDAWELLCTCTGGQYVLSHIGECCTRKACVWRSGRRVSGAWYWK